MFKNMWTDNTYSPPVLTVFSLPPSLYLVHQLGDLELDVWNGANLLAWVREGSLSGETGKQCWKQNRHVPDPYGGWGNRQRPGPGRETKSSPRSLIYSLCTVPWKHIKHAPNHHFPKFCLIKDSLCPVYESSLQVLWRQEVPSSPSPGLPKVVPQAL